MKIFQIRFLTIFTIVVFVFFLTLAGENSWAGPGREVINEKASEENKDNYEIEIGVSSQDVILLGFIRFYQKYISPVDNRTCPFYPTCSMFGFEAIRKYGFIGLLMLIDRLFFRDPTADEMHYEMIKVGDVYRYYDPVEDNYLFKEVP
jgi:putative component of membrane protein insertase Oxa1/YidC/SpoIIIJ protein YidD